VPQAQTRQTGPALSAPGGPVSATVPCALGAPARAWICPRQHEHNHATGLPLALEVVVAVPAKVTVPVVAAVRTVTSMW
jgi:hypothetical protein